MMTLREAIEHATNVALDEDVCEECQREHKQLAEWLERLAAYEAADVAPVRHGRWIMWGGKLHCPNCEDLAPLKRGWEDGCTTYEYTASRYCPNCGVKMDGGETP